MFDEGSLSIEFILGVMLRQDEHAWASGVASWALVCMDPPLRSEVPVPRTDTAVHIGISILTAHASQYSGIGISWCGATLKFMRTKLPLTLQSMAKLPSGCAYTTEWRCWGGVSNCISSNGEHGQCIVIRQGPKLTFPETIRPCHCTVPRPRGTAALSP